MSKIKTYQSSFNLGVLSPEMFARVDIEQYYRGAKTIDNGIVLPQGGVRKRNGFKMLSLIADLDDSEYRLDNDGNFDTGNFKLNQEGGAVRIIPYTSDGIEFIITITQDGILQIFSANGDELQAPTDITAFIFGDAVEEMQYKQVANDLVVLSKYFEPFIIIRNKDGSFSVNNITDLQIPTTTFQQTITVGIWNEVSVTFNFINNGDQFTLGYVNDEVQGLYQVDKLPLSGDNALAGDDATTMAADIEAALNIIQAGHTVTPIYETSVIKLKNSAGDIVDVTLQEFLGLRIGKPTQAKFFCKSKSNHESEIRTEATGGTFTDTASTNEPVWSENRGWPRVGGEFSGRFILAGSLSLPETVWLSQVYAYYNFVYPGSPVATDAIEVTIATEQASIITGIVDSRRLTVITSKTAYTIQGASSSVITPDSISVDNINQKGSKLIRPEVLDGNLFYVQLTGSELSSTIYDFNSDAYLNLQASIYSAHLLNDVKQLCKTLSDSEFNAEYLTVMNRDGTLASYSSLKEQQIQNWTRITTKGQVVDVAGINSNVYALIRRGTEGNVKVTLEVMSKEARLCDMSQTFTSSTPFSIIGGFERFAGETLVALADDYDIEVVVDEDGVVELPFSALDVSIGLPFEYVIEPMPLNVQLQSGMIQTERKRITEADINMLESRDVTIEYSGKDYKVSERRIGFKLGEPPQPFTGIKTKRFTGWIDSGSVKIKSSRPVDVTILGILLKARVKG